MIKSSGKTIRWRRKLHRTSASGAVDLRTHHCIRVRLSTCMWAARNSIKLGFMVQRRENGFDFSGSHVELELRCLAILPRLNLLEGTASQPPAAARVSWTSYCPSSRVGTRGT
jgi:hypothetical protein